jgi:hypothetical protein
MELHNLRILLPATRQTQLYFGATTTTRRRRRRRRKGDWSAREHGSKLKCAV